MLEDIQVVLGRAVVAGVESQGVERIGQHAPRRLEAAVEVLP